METTQTLVSDYEQDRRRLHAEMIVKVAKILGATTDELLGSKPARGSAGNGALSLKLTRRLHRIEAYRPRVRSSSCKPSTRCSRREQLKEERLRTKNART